MKPFKNLDEQVDILKSRGLIFTNEIKAKDYLLKNNYYNVTNMYSKFLCDDVDKYIVGADFSEIVAIHIFDKELKNILIKNALIIENVFKSVISYRYSEETKNQGSFPYLNKYGYDLSDPFKYAKEIAELVKIIENKKRHSNTSVSHYLKRHNDVPIWVLINYMDFGQTINFYRNLNNTIKHKIARDLNDFANSYLNPSDEIRLDFKDYEVIVDNIKNIRNISAHNNKLFDYQTRYSYPFVECLHEEISSNRSSVYDCIVIMKLFLSPEQYSIMINSIHKRMRNLSKKLKVIEIYKIINTLGFPNNYQFKKNI